MDIWMHRQGLEGRPGKNLAFFTSKSVSPQKLFAIGHKYRRDEQYACFGARLTFKMGWMGR